MWCFVKDGKVVSATANAEGNQWNDQTLGNLAQMFVNDRQACIDMGIFEFVDSPTISPYHNLGAATYDINVDTGVVTASYEQVLKSDEELMAIKRKEISSYKKNCLNSGILFKGKVVQTDETALVNLTNLASRVARKAIPQSGFRWRTKDNEFLQLSVSECTDLVKAVDAHRDQCIDNQATLESALSSLSGEALAVYDVSTGWKQLN